MRNLSVVVGVVATVLGVLATQPAQAQAIRTWVSGVGNDADPCSRTAPCKTFAGAISKTAAGGEINCLDPGGFGTLTITKSITIDCTGTFGSLLNSGVNGIVIASTAPAGAVVRLRGISINGASINGAGTTLGANGIRWLASSGQLHVERVLIMNQSTKGIDFLPTAGIAELYVVDTTISEVGGTSSSSSNAAIFIRPGGAAFGRATVSRTTLINNAGGLTADSTGGGGMRVMVADSVASGNANNGILATTSAGVRLTINRTAVTTNTTGVQSQGPGASIQISHSVVTQNGTGVLAAGGATLTSFASNIISDNDSNGAFTSVPVQ